MTSVWCDMAQWVVGIYPQAVHTSSGRIVRRVRIAEGNYIAGCLSLPLPASVPALTLTLLTVSIH